MNRKLLSAAMVCVASTMVAGLSTTVADAEVEQPVPAAVDWHPCELDNAMDCGTVPVPVDYSNPTGPTVDIAVARRHATGARIGTLLVNPGGPSNSGVFFAISAHLFLSPELLSRFDIVGFDPRGVVRSGGVRCDEKLVDNPPVSEFPHNAAEFDLMKRYHDELGRSCAELTGPLFNTIHSANVARDMDAIRVALGESRISYWGVSYGTMIGQMYAERFPNRIRAMVLDSVIDHTEDPLGYEITGAKGIEAQFLHFAEWARKTPDSPLFGADVVAIWDHLYAKAAAGELTDPDEPTRLVSTDELGQLLIDNFQNTIFYWDTADELVRLHSGAVERTPAARQRPSGKAEPTCGFCFDTNVYRSVLCEDFSFPVGSFDQLMEIRRQAERFAPHTRINTFNWTDVTGCQGWPAPVGNPQHRLSFRGVAPPPILVANNRADATTPLEWARSVAGQLPGSVLLVHEGAGHNSYRRSTCMQQHQDRYLVDLRLPPAGTTCAASPVPPRPVATATVTAEPGGR